MYEYRAEVLRVLDGDTIYARVDLGLDVQTTLTLRLAGIDAPELPTVEGVAAKAHLAGLIGLPENSQVMIRTQKDKRERYGRYLATLIRADGLDINAQMITDGHAVAYDGHGPRVP
ncbi:MAG: nuclease [Anaerolinea sp.]|nr:nuclease [Anaerolinea sp.]